MPRSVLAAIAVVVAGLALVVAGLLVGDSPAPSTVSSEVHLPEMFPRPDEAPEVVDGAPGSREQLMLLGGMVLSLGVLGVIATTSSAAARRARDQSNETVKSAG